jgi:predicted ATPase
MSQLVVISGCSGGGKSTLLEELRRRGHATVEEPGRRIVAEELRRGGSALPWLDPIAFAQRAIALALEDMAVAALGPSGWTFVDRGLVDAVVALEHVTGEPVPSGGEHLHGYYRQVFLAPPWPEIYLNDSERRHTFDDANAEYSRLIQAYPALGYQVSVLPKTGVEERADFVRQTLTDDLLRPA